MTENSTISMIRLMNFQKISTSKLNLYLKIIIKDKNNVTKRVKISPLKKKIPLVDSHVDIIKDSIGITKILIEKVSKNTKILLPNQNNLRKGGKETEYLTNVQIIMIEIINVQIIMIEIIIGIILH